MSAGLLRGEAMSVGVLSAPRRPVGSGRDAVRGLSMVGWSHRTCALAGLEQVSLRREQRAGLLATLQDSGCVGAVVLSTCSRTEVYAGPAAHTPDDLLDLVAAHLGRPGAELAPTSLRLTGADVVEHLFRVTAGLDSRIIGEDEIRGQVRGACRESQAAGTTTSLLASLFSGALGAARRVRGTTGLGTQGLSVGRRAVELGLTAVGDGRDLVVVVVGSGRMAGVAVGHLAGLGHRVHVVARNQDAAARLVSPDRVLPMVELAVALSSVDLLICTTSAAHDVVTEAQVRLAMRGRARPLTVVDVSVPRNVDPRVAAVAGVRLLDVEALCPTATGNGTTLPAVERASALAQVEARRFVDSVAARDAGPVIAALRRSVELACLAELVRTAPAGSSREELQRAAHAVAGRLLHRPCLLAREAAQAGDAARLQLLWAVLGEQAEAAERLPVA